MPNTLQYTLKGVILKDNKVYVPLEELVSFCKKFPIIKAEQISEVIDKSVKNLLANDELLKQVPRVVVDTSITNQ